MTISALYDDINRHLLQDEKPSIYFNQIYGEPIFQKPPFDMLYRLKQTEQSPQHHPEGNAWNHTMLVTDQAAKVKSKSKNPRVFMWAALLHDIGKPSTTRNKKGKITAYDHDKAGAILAKKFLDTLTNDEPFIHAAVQLVRWHMQILFVVNNLPFADIGAMKEQTDVSEVALLGLCDRLGRTNTDKKTEEKNITLFLNKCSSFNQRGERT